jgi:hypothetical protein
MAFRMTVLLLGLEAETPSLNTHAFVEDLLPFFMGYDKPVLRLLNRLTLACFNVGKRFLFKHGKALWHIIIRGLCYVL